MKKSIFLICVISFSLACSAQPVKQVEWLQGNWKGLYKNAPFYEAWRKATDSVIVNFTIEIKGSDTIVKENGAILLMKHRRGYAGTDAMFKLESLSDNQIILTSDTVKYANKIIWSHSTNDHWLTEIYSPNGTIVKYDMERVPWLEGVVNRFIARMRKQ